MTHYTSTIGHDHIQIPVGINVIDRARSTPATLNHAIITRVSVETGINLRVGARVDQIWPRLIAGGSCATLEIGAGHLALDVQVRRLT
jgi:hypothetical protein